MKLRRLAALLLCLGLLAGLAGCAGDAVQISVWRRSEGSVAVPESRRLPAGTELIAGLAAAFNSEPDEPGRTRAAPEGADILGWRLEGVELKLEVSQGWAELEGFERTVAEGCAVLTFCGIEGIERVSFYLLGQRLGPAMDAGDLILAAEMEAE